MIADFLNIVNYWMSFDLSLFYKCFLTINTE